MTSTELTPRERALADLYGDLHQHATDTFALEYLLPGFRQHLQALGLDPDRAVKGQAFLDAGCGGFAGGVAVALALGASPIVGIDLSAANVEQARRRFAGQPAVSFIQQNLRHLTLESDTFDFVYCNGVLHHTEVPEQAFRELVRVTRPGGRLYIGVYGRGGLFGWLAAPAMRLAGRVVPRQLTAMLLKAVPVLLRPSTSLMDFMYAPIQVRFRRAEVESWFNASGIRPTFLRHYYQPPTRLNRLLFGEGTMMFFSGVKEP